MTTAEALHDIAATLNLPVKEWKWSNALTAGGYPYHEPSARYVCAGAKLPSDIGMLACAVASEFGTWPTHMLAGAHAILNDCHERDKPLTIEQRVTMLDLRRKWHKLWTKYPAAGYFGKQTTRWCSTWQVPTLRSVAVARLALQGAGAELARGARRWINPHVQNATGKRSAKDVITSWYDEGWRWVGPVEGINAQSQFMLGRRGRPLAEALQALS